jgi:hypothetical protein
VLFLNGQFLNGVGTVGPDILSDILSTFRQIEMLLQHFQYLFYAKVSYHPTIVSFPNHILLLT